MKTEEGKSPWKFDSATQADDAALRQLLRETPLPGAITATLEREPSFFGGDIDALQHDAFLVCHEGLPAACGSRILRRSWVEGEALETAYLADLRVQPQFHGRFGRQLIKGYRMVEKCAEARPAAMTWTAIFENNIRARSTLTGRSVGLPHYDDLGRLLCPAILVRKRASLPSLGGIEWQVNGNFDWAEIVDFLTRQQQHRPLAPVHSVEDFVKGNRWPGLRTEDFILARKGTKLVGMVAVWDQRAFRQIRIQRLSTALRMAAPFWNLAAAVTGWPKLPNAGKVLPMAHASFLAVEGNSASLAHGLLNAARAVAARRGIGWLCTCLHEKDPLVSALKGLPGIASNGRLYQVSSKNEELRFDAAPVIESAAL